MVNPHVPAEMQNHNRANVTATKTLEEASLRLLEKLLPIKTATLRKKMTQQKRLHKTVKDGLNMLEHRLNNQK